MWKSVIFLTIKNMTWFYRKIAKEHEKTPGFIRFKLYYYNSVIKHKIYLGKIFLLK